MEKIIIFNLQTDADDAVLGFTTDWINAFAKRFSRVFVITMLKGQDETAGNVEVYSAGKEKGYSKPRRIQEFYKIFFKIIKEHKISGIFAHMIPEFAVLAGPWATKYKIPMVLWFAHKRVPWTLRLAAHYADKIFTPSAESCLLSDRSKIIVTGHGINQDKFKPLKKAPRADGYISVIGRISPIKDQLTFLRAAKLLIQNKIFLKFMICGNIGDENYYKKVLAYIKKNKLDKYVKLSLLVNYKKIPSVYQQSRLTVNLCPRGGLDKVVLESLLSGVPALTSNSSFLNICGAGAIFQHGDPGDLFDKITRNLKKYNKTAFRKAKAHQLNNIVAKFAEVIEC